MQLSEISQRDWQRYSFRRILTEPIRDGIEHEIHRDMQNNLPQSPAGTFIPFAALAQRDLTAGNVGSGGAFVQTDVQSSVIGLLRNKTVVLRLGAQSLTGLRGNVALPRQTSSGTAQSLPETGRTNSSNATFDQPNLIPHRVSFACKYSKALLLQSSPDVENFVRQDLIKTISVKMDKLCLEGDGSNSEPTGVKNTSGIGSAAFNGQVSWPGLVDFETRVSDGNGMTGPAAFVTTPTVRGKLRCTPKIASSAFPVFCFEDRDWRDGTDDGLICGYRAAATNQVTQNMVAFGVWSELVVGIWGDGFDIVVNPFTYASEGEVEVTGHLFFDCAVRHPQSFCWSADAGNQ